MAESNLSSFIWSDADLLRGEIDAEPQGMTDREPMTTVLLKRAHAEARGSRSKIRIHAVDSSVIQLVANCMGWAKHRRRKAAAKMHLRLNLHNFLPTFAIVDTAGEHDNKRARELCANIAPGEIVIFDKAHVEVDGAWRIMVFITNNTTWSPRSVCDLYRIHSRPR